MPGDLEPGAVVLHECLELHIELGPVRSVKPRRSAEASIAFASAASNTTGSKPDQTFGHYPSMTSGAAHDIQMIERIAPAAMIRTEPRRHQPQPSRTRSAH